MSWSFNHTGTREGVAAKIMSESYVPDLLKKAIVDVIRTPVKSTCRGVTVVSNGHVDEGSAYAKVEITQVSIHLDPPVAVPVGTPPVSDPAPATHTD